ncbi:MAG: ABC transporter ATP-binding protein [Chloroflexi bacterium]|nr:ABC transporter ATP-binding protein [Chloroflexota bacterium]
MNFYRNEMKQTLLEVQKLSATFTDHAGSLRVLDKLSFEVMKGDFLCVLGPSGSGKSTLLRILAGLVRSNSGTVTIKQRALHGPQPGIGLVFQDANLMPWRTVLENIALPLEVRNHTNGTLTRAKRLVELVGLQGFEHALPHDLSGGMAQRVAIARALVQDPDVLLMDEPFGSLDAITRERMGEELLRIWEMDHKTVILVTHDISEAIYLADRVLVLSARPASLKLDLKIQLPRPRRPSVRYTREFGKLAARLRAAIEAENHL